MVHTMKTLTVLLLSALICGTFYSVSSASTARVSTGSAQSDATTSSTVQPFFLNGLLSSVEKGFITVPGDVAKLLRNQLRELIQNILNLLQIATEPVIHNIDSTIDQLCTATAPVNTSSRRRRDLLGLIPSSARQLIPSNLLYLIQAPANATSGQIREIANNSAELLEQVLVTRGLPLVHHILDNLNNTGYMPNFLSSIINRFDVLFSALEVLGYVRP